jgi:tetratricopeptide (TPR) repeat protein
MDIAHKAHFNALRMGYLRNPAFHYEPWMVEDLSQKDTGALFLCLQENNIYLDRGAFITFSEQFDCPEELMDWLVGEKTLEPDDFDKIYLILFELWRRLIPEKMSLSLFANELDWQIFRYDEENIESQSALEDNIENLHNILEENVDHGMEPQEAFAALSEFFANDLEGFLYDFILIQLDRKDFTYARELVEQFYPFVINKIWFHLLQARLVAQEDIDQANEMIRTIFESNKEDNDIDLNLDILATMVHAGDHELFLEICLYTLSQIDNEDDFRELLLITSDYFRCLDQDNAEEKINTLIKTRAAKNIGCFSKQDRDIEAFREILSLSGQKIIP